MPIKKFNVKAGLSVGTSPIVDVIDDTGNATFNSVTTGNVTANLSSASEFFVFPTYTATTIRAIAGQIGWCAAVSDSTPGGKHAYWDTTNARWAYVSDDSAV